MEYIYIYIHIYIYIYDVYIYIYIMKGYDGIYKQTLWSLGLLLCLETVTDIPKAQELFQKGPARNGWGDSPLPTVAGIHTGDSRDDVGNANYRYGINIDVKNRDISGTILITSYLIMANLPDKLQKNEKS